MHFKWYFSPFPIKTIVQKLTGVRLWANVWCHKRLESMGQCAQNFFNYDK